MIKILSFVDSFKQYENGILEFQKRLGKKVKLVKLKPSKKKNEIEVKKEETDKLRKVLEKSRGYKVLLFIGGDNLCSLEFQNFILEKEMNFGNIVFIIGGAFGVNYKEIEDLIDFKFSFSRMTFPHSLALLMLYEQIYRGVTISLGKSYHK